MIGHRARPSRSLIAVAGLLLWACIAGLALDPAQLPKPQGYVSDFARVLDAGAVSEIEQYCARVEQSTGAQIAVVTIPSLDGAPVEDFTNDLFRRWGVGKKGKDEGVMLLLAVRDRKSRVEVGYGLEPILPDGFAGSVLREMTPSLKEQNYGQALLAGTAEIGDRVAKAKGVTLVRTLPRRAPPAETPAQGDGIPWPLILIGVVLLFGLLGRGGRGGGGMLSWFLLGNVLGGSRYGGGGWGGGGFGGGGSGGGGFGGFGGGDSGGGGASGSW